MSNRHILTHRQKETITETQKKEDIFIYSLINEQRLDIRYIEPSTATLKITHSIRHKDIDKDNNPVTVIHPFDIREHILRATVPE